jgi:hypothetical protein
MRAVISIMADPCGIVVAILSNVVAAGAQQPR